MSFDATTADNGDDAKDDSSCNERTAALYYWMRMGRNSHVG